MKIEMRELRPEDALDAARVHKAVKDLDDWEFLLSNYVHDEEFCAYLDRVAAWKDESTVPEGKVPSTFLIAVIDGKIAGRLSIRHRLNEFLALVGGHIGYGVTPEFRGQGIAIYMLEYGVNFARELGIERVFISCHSENDASRRVIEKCGGEFAALVPHPYEDGELYRTY
ncbi:MAG: GNAT family N-acetyltransferase, partial [Candidatus Planktophila sp.]